MISPQRERRREPRVSLERPCKVYEPRLRRYVPARTRDVSSRGLLLHIARPLDLKPGDRLYVGVAETRRQAIIRSAQMLPARVVRILRGVDGRAAAVAVEFASSAVAEPSHRLAA